ncbi:MAG: hypothetical protein MRERC_1c097 [Mycoplasmataceae bacterium RC_NB112A]|nr:MAG: hypothetical protein MRERC_1c097 [Mycoplasmataceae bacterium RC_NB112A]
MFSIKVTKENREVAWVTFKKLSTRVLQEQRKNLYFQKKPK